MNLPFPTREEIARLSARMLLEIKAVDFNAGKPFTYASGLKGPTYVDCRRIIMRVSRLSTMWQAVKRRGSPLRPWSRNGWACR